MGIKYFKDRKIFHLYTNEYSYYIHINKLGYLIHLYDGKFLDDISKERTSERYMERFAYLNNKNKEICDEDYYFSSLASKFECASFGKGDKRNPFAIIQGEDGIDITNFLFSSFKIINGIDRDYPLPQFKFRDNEVKTLIITLKDENREVYLDLYYLVSSKYNVFVRYSKIINKTRENIKIKKLMSFELDLDSSDYEILSLKGTWGNDREIEKIPLTHSLLKIEDNRGGRGFYHNPSCALIKNGTNYDYGEVYGFSFIYSGDFAFEFKVDQIDQTRILIGINPENFEYNLKENESFITPCACLIYTNNGINKMSHYFHNVIRDRLLPQVYAHKERPILINSWEAMYFDFDTNKIINFIKKSKEAGIELVVLDDGWFGKRNNDDSSLGDWYINFHKIDLKKCIDFAHSLNMKFGIWIEPEMISHNSKLFQLHPEYALYPKNYKNPTLFRHQLCLDLVNDEARDYVYNLLIKIFDKYPLDYIKWDFNRFITEGYSDTLSPLNKKETYHRFVLGAYDLLNKITSRYPHMILETCASGGGRFDLGMLYYSTQIWASDETDLVLRNSIQYATNIFYPLSTIGAHVSSRKDGSIQDKACLAFFGTYGYELDITKLTKEDILKIKEFNGLVKKYHHIITNGNYYALLDPNTTNYCSWNVVSKNRKQCLAYFFNYRKEPTKTRFLKLKGLNPDSYYFNSLTNDIYKGSFYMNVGLNLSAPLDSFLTALFILQEVDNVKATIYRKTKQKDGGKRDKLI